MKILINDVIQNSDASDELKSPSLADVEINSIGTITLDATYDINCIGIGYTDATEVIINGETIVPETTEQNGLYELVTPLNTNTLVVSHNGTYIGRLAAGLKRTLGASPTNEPGFYTTQTPRVTASGQTVEGAGGVSGRRIDLDFRYKFTETIYTDIQTAYAGQLAKGFPLFMFFDIETRMPYTRLYASTDNNLLFQGAVNRFLYSRRFSFLERF